MKDFFQDFFTKNITNNDNRTVNNNIVIEGQNNPFEKTKDEEHLSRLKSVYEITIATRNLEIGQLVQRNNFFMIFQGVLFACLIYSSNTVPYVHLILCSVGFYVAYSQTAVAAGAKYWQEFWEKKLETIEQHLLKFYKKDDKNLAVDNNLTEFYQLFSTEQSEINNDVIKQLDRNTKDESFTSKLNNFWNYTLNLRVINYFTFLKVIYSRELILNKPSVSKIPIRVGRFFMIAWGLLFISTLWFPNKWLEDKNLNESFLRGFPTHKEAAKQEIYFSADKPISNTAIPLNIQIKDFEKNNNNQPINIELSINGQKIEAKGVIK
ncbi:RipA family octameric membrane protein [Acinetobacter indicus]|uniref:RipA family octameric membrane protein n=1 Tax=Acinetobacter indicus TaxID=756892 RepID=UPI0014442BCF|nr:hypothetical protein [Acinetobacter indicus]